jgi:hypothetical protein
MKTIVEQGRRGNDRMVVGFTTSYVVSSNLNQGEMYNIMWSSLSVVFSGSSGSSTNKTDHHDITEILLKVALNTIKQINRSL